MGYYIYTEDRRRLSSPEQLEKLAMFWRMVSSNMLAAIAKSDEFKDMETISGFLQMRNAACDLTNQGYDSRLGI